MTPAPHESTWASRPTPRDPLEGEHPLTPGERRIGLYLELAGQVSLRALPSDAGVRALAGLLVGDEGRRHDLESAMTPTWRREIVLARTRTDFETFAALFRRLLPHASTDHVRDIWVALTPEG